ELQPNEAYWWNVRGYAYFRLRQWDKALADITKAIELQPKMALYRHNRGSVYARMGQHAKAVADHIKASELNPKDPWVWCKQGSAFAELVQWEKSAAAFGHATALKPDLPLAWYCLAMSQLGRGDRAGYRKACSRMLERFDQSANADAAFWTAWTCVLAPDTVGD